MSIRILTIRPKQSVTWPKVKRVCIIYYQIMICPASPHSSTTMHIIEFSKTIGNSCPKFTVQNPKHHRPHLSLPSLLQFCNSTNEQQTLISQELLSFVFRFLPFFHFWTPNSASSSYWLFLSQENKSDRVH
jgi:hypothetical protein